MPDRSIVDGRDVATLDRRALYALRRRMGMLFQNGALLTDLDVFENVAFPLREHTRLPERLIRNVVLMKLHAVGLRGAAELIPATALGRHGAPRGARARHRDGPRHPDLRRALRRARSDLDGRGHAADPAAQRRTQHQQHRCHARRARDLADRGHQLHSLGRAGRRERRPEESSRRARRKSCASLSAGRRMARCRFTIRRRDYYEQLLGGWVS